MIAAGLTVLPSKNEAILNTVFVYVPGILGGRTFPFIYYFIWTDEIKLDIHLCFFSAFFYLDKQNKC